MKKTIVEKLNLTKYKKVVVLDLPEGSDYFSDLAHYETTLTNNQSYDLIFSFVLDMESLKSIVDKVINENFLTKNGYLLLAYPKKGNKKYSTFLHRDSLFEGVGADENGFIGGSTIKFNRMVGLDDVFTIVGLKEDSKSKNATSSKASQCVDDYLSYIPEIEKDLSDVPELLTFYQALTPGYQKDWARYIYSAKQESTKVKRREEMKLILACGYKSRDLYRRNAN